MPTPKRRISRYLRWAQKLVDAKAGLLLSAQSLTTGDIALLEREHPDLAIFLRVGTGGVSVRLGVDD